MTYRRRHRWLRRLALGLAFATFAAPAAAKHVDESSDGFRYVTAGGWSGEVYSDTGIPVSAGIPRGDEGLIADQSTDVIPYLSQGILTEADQAAATAEAIHDPQRSPSVLGEAVKSRQAPELFVQGVTDFGKGAVVEQPQLLSQRQLETLATENGAPAATRPDDRADRFTGIEQPQVVNYLSHGMAADGEVGARPDDKAERFAHSDVVSRPELASTGSEGEWNDAMLMIGIGAVVLALALGLGLGFVTRPRLAGL